MSSLIAMVLKWTGLSQGVMELIAIGVVAASVAGFATYEHHKIYTEGVNAAHAEQKKQDDADKAILEKRATTAEQKYAKAQTELDTYRNSNPLGAVRLCVPAANHVQAHKAVSISSGANSGPAAVSGVPAGDQGSGPNVAGPDIGPMLDLLALRAAQVAAQAIELQESH